MNIDNFIEHTKKKQEKKQAIIDAMRISLRVIII